MALVVHNNTEYLETESSFFIRIDSISAMALYILVAVVVVVVVIAVVEVGPMAVVITVFRMLWDHGERQQWYRCIFPHLLCRYFRIFQISRCFRCCCCY